MMTGEINTIDLTHLRKVLEDLPKGLLAYDNGYEVILDTRCTKTGTGHHKDFIARTLRKLDPLIAMSGITGSLPIEEEGVMRFEVIDDKGELQVIEAEAYLIPGLQCRLFSPQAYFKQLSQDGSDPHKTAHMTVKKGGIELVLANGA